MHSIALFAYDKATLNWSNKMDFCRTIFHVVQQGDTFYRLAQRYHTTVPDIITRNPGINPYNLQVGSRLRICVGPGAEGNQRPEEMDLNKDMRQAWSKHNMWDAMFMISLFNALENTEAVQNRLMQTPADITAVFEKFYSMPITNQLKQLLTEHVRLAGELTAAMNNNNMEETQMLETQLNQNADQIARMLASTNNRYDYEELRRMLRMHLDIMKNSMNAELNGEHAEAIRLVDESEEHLMELADILTQGLVEQFYMR